MMFNFYVKEKPHWQQKKEILFESLKLLFASDKDFSIKLGGVDKTPRQLRGFYRICTILAPYLEEANGVFFDKDMVKEYVKQESNYLTVIKGRVITKSLARASREELRLMIEKLYELGAFFDAKGYQLTSYEEKALLEYYGGK